MGTTRTLYIDSHKANGSGSDFTYFLKQSIQCPENTIAHIDEVICPNVFLTVDNIRKYLYLAELTAAGVSTPLRATIVEGDYSAVDLAVAVQTALNQVTTMVDSAGNATTYTVTYQTEGPSVYTIRALARSPLERGRACSHWGARQGITSERLHRMRMRPSGWTCPPHGAPILCSYIKWYALYRSRMSVYIQVTSGCLTSRKKLEGRHP